MVIRNQCLMGLTVVCIMLCGSGAQSLAEECSSKLPEVMTCVAFASGKEATPVKKCCDSVRDIKESNPACLCFLILQIHNGTNPALKDMNIQETRLLQLPSACKMANATITDCPKLLKLPTNSADAAIFKNVTSTPTPSTDDSTSTTNSDSSYGLKLKHDTPTLIFIFLSSFLSLLDLINLIS